MSNSKLRTTFENLKRHRRVSYWQTESQINLPGILQGLIFMATSLPHSKELYHSGTGIRFKTVIILLLCVIGAFAVGRRSAGIFQARPEPPSVAVVIPP